MTNSISNPFNAAANEGPYLPHGKPALRKKTPAHPRPSLRLPRLKKKSRPGAVAGIELDALARMPSSPGPVSITCIDYAPENVQVQDVRDIDDFVARHRPEWSAVRWINIAGLTDMRAIHALAEKYNLHPLAIEDVLHVTHRPKVEAYAAEGRYQARVFIVVRMLEIEAGNLHSEQISVFLGHNTVLCFQERPSPVWDNVRQQISIAGSRLRRNDASLLVHALLDAIVDHCFPILEYFGDHLEETEQLVLERPSQEIIRQIHRLKNDLLLLRRTLWPMREVINTLQREPHECLSETTRTYMRDVYDHTVQIIDILETYRDISLGLTETYMTAMSNRMNEIMKVLTIIGTIFIPLTFLAGVYGMNFEHFPELRWPWGYPAFWVVSLLTAGGMILWFIRRKWL
jgi:magnesium transporter